MRAITAFRKSSSFTLSIVFTVMLMMAALFVTYIMVIANDDLLVRESEAAINADILGFHSLHKVSKPEDIANEITNRINNTSTDFYYHFKDQNNRLLAGNISEWPKPNSPFLKNGILKLTIPAVSQHDDDVNVIAKIVTFDNQHKLLIGRNIEEIQLAQWIGKTFGWVMILFLCLISAASIWVAYYVVNRINDISDKADNIISTGDLSKRLPIDSDWDDLSKLSVSLNLMLEQFEQSVANIRSVSDSIAHDLRTPLTRLKTHIEKLENSEEKYALIKESDNLLSIFNSLLRIAEIETERKKSQFKENDIETMLDDVVDLYTPVIEAKNIDLEVYVDLQNNTFTCDKNLLFQAFANVIDNALKFTLEYGEIEIALFTTEVLKAKEKPAGIFKVADTIDTTQNTLIFTVFDTGIGVTNADIEKLTQRFYRAEKSRTTKGNGLGLSLVAAVAELHGGNVNFISDPLRKGHGLGCVISLPLS